VRRLDIRVYRRSAFLIFCEPGAIEMDAGTTAGAIRRDRVRSFSFFLEQNSGANAPRERLVIAGAAKQSSSCVQAQGSTLRREACHRAGHFGPNQWAPALFGKRKATACAARMLEPCQSYLTG